jgi:hypothetical protein
MINQSKGAVELMRPTVFSDSEAPLCEGGGGDLGFSSVLGAMDGTPGLVLVSPLGDGGVEGLGLVSAPLGGTAGPDSPAAGGGGVSSTGVGAGAVVLMSGGGDIGDEVTGELEGDAVGGDKLSWLSDCLVRLANTTTIKDSLFKQLSLTPLMKKNDPDRSKVNILLPSSNLLM